MTVVFINGGGHVEHWLGRALGERRVVSELRSDVVLRPAGSKISSLPALLASEPALPSLYLHATDEFLPLGLERARLATACILVDVFVGLDTRVHWAMLFDYVFVCHPRFVGVFQAAGHPNVYSLPLAAPETYVRAEGDDSARQFEVGWVGRSEGPLFAARARILPRLARRFRMNEWRAWHSYEQTSEVFRRSRIVVNVSRDDYPEDANMRVFEAMAAGAMLITRVPTELSELGFLEGEHFVGYRHEDELEEIVCDYLDRHEERLRIARQGNQVVRQEHTYANRAQTILETIEQSGARFYAPSRSWPEERVFLAYLDYYCSGSSLRLAAQMMGSLMRSNAVASVKGLPLIARAVGRRVRNTLQP